MMDIVRKFMKSGKKPKEAIAMALADKRKMSRGGEVESMEELGEDPIDSQERSLAEIQKDGDMNPASVANPETLAKAVMAYAMGGLVEGGPEEHDELHGNQPEEAMVGATSEPMSSMPEKPSALDHAAIEALKKKKASRRYA